MSTVRISTYRQVSGIRWRRCAGVASLLLSLLAPLTAQDANTDTAPPPTLGQEYSSSMPTPAMEVPQSMAADLVAPAAGDSYVIGPDDLLSVFVYQMPALTRQVRVDHAGNISLPFVAQPIHASGETAPELSSTVARLLETLGLAHEPRVQLVVRQVMSKPVIVNGDVSQPLTLQAARPITLVEALSRAGGLTRNAGDVLLLTTGLDTANPVTKRLSLNSIMHQAAASRYKLTGNDAITVLPAPLVYAVGDFKLPGAFPLRAGQPITVLRAIALAEGLHSTADKKKAVIIHTKRDGTRTITKVNIERIRHQLIDPQLQPGDVLYVPVNGTRIVLVEALKDAAQAGVIAVGYHY